MRNKIISLILFIGVSRVVCASAPDGVSDGYNWHYTIDAGRMLLTVKDVTPTQNADLDLDISLEVITSGKYTVTVDDGAFSSCKEMRSIILPSHISRITAAAFDGCDRLNSIDVKKTSEINIAAENGLLLNHAKTEVIACPRGRSDAEIPAGVTNVLTHAFKGCKKLVTLSVPLSVERMGQFAFEGCDNLKTVYYVGTGSMESSWGRIYFAQKDDEFTYNNPLYYAQEFYTKQTTSGEEKLVTYVSAGQEVSRFAYYGCKSLESVVLNKTKVNMWAFAECPKLRSLTIERQDSVVSSSCFYGCTNLTSITLSGNAVLDYSVEDGVLYTADKKKLVLLPASKREYTVPTTLFIPGDGYLKRFEYSFGGCRLLEKLVLPDTANYIMNDFIRDCGAENKFKVYVPASYVQTAQGAFEGCANGTTIIFEGDPPWNSMSHYRCTVWETNVTAIGISAAHFEKWVENAESVLSKCYIEYFDVECENALQDGVLCIGTTVPSACLDRGISPVCIEIPASWNAVPVREIGPRAFKEYFKLATVSLPESLVRIGTGAFYMCKELCSMAIPESVISVGADAVYGCEKLGQRIGGAMYLSGWLIDVVGVEGDEFAIPNGVKHLADKSFAAGPNLSVIEIPQSVETIGRDAFRGTKYLNGGDEFVVRDGWLLAYNGSASEITIPSNVRRIADGVFADNVTLERVNIGNDVEYVGSYALMGCKNLQEVKYDSRSTKMGYDVFNGSSSSLQIDDLAYCQVRFESNGAGDVQPQNKKSGCAIGELPEVSKDGSVFLGWYTEADGGELVSESYVINADITLYAHWAPAFCRATFFANGGLFQQQESSSMIEKDFAYGTRLVGLPEVARYNYNFAGWYDSLAAGGRAVYGTVVTSNLNCYAYWESTIIFNANGGMCDVKEIHCVNDVSAVDFPVAERDGYVFRGWRTSWGTKVECPSAGQGNMMLYAQWRREVTTVIFDSNGGAGEMDNQVFFADEDKPLSKNLFSRPGFLFCGWALTSNGQVKYSDEYKMYEFPTENDDVMRLYAVWAPMVKYAVLPGGGVQVTGLDDRNAVEAYIPSSIGGKKVTQVAMEAFSGYSNLRTVRIAEGVESVLGYAFENCSNLEFIEIPDSVTMIAGSVFKGCSKLKTVTLPSRITSLGGVFSGCGGLESIEIPEGVTSIDRAFYNCKKLKVVKLPSTLTSIGINAFYGTSLESIEIPDSVKSIGESAFYETSLGEIEIPGTVTSIGASAFKNCSKLTIVHMPSSVTTIGADAFAGCSRIGIVSIPSCVSTLASVFPSYQTISNIVIVGGVDTIQKEAFKNCYALCEVTIPSSVKTIGADAFYNCEKIKTVTVPLSKKLSTIFPDAYFRIEKVNVCEDVTTICADACENCSNLTSVQLPDGLKHIGDHSFYNCSKLDTVEFPDGLVRIGIGAFEYCRQFVLSSIPESVNEIGGRAFLETRYWEGLKNGFVIKDSCLLGVKGEALSGIVVIPSDVRLIAGDAFAGMRNIEDVTIPEGVGVICQYAFYGCSGLKTVSFPKTLENVGSMAFYDCTGLKRVNVKDIVSWCSVECLSSPFSNSGRLYCDGNEVVDLVIPEGVSAIGSRAFSGCASIESVTLPSTLKTVGVEAFRDCAFLKAVKIKNVSSWCSIEFANEAANPLLCAKHLYLNNELVTDLILPTDTKTVGAYAFYGGECLRSVAMPGVVDVGGHAFQGCIGLLSVALPIGLKSIGEYSFYGCTGLGSLVIPCGVEGVGQYAFYDCSGISALMIPNSVTTVGRAALYLCDALKIIYVDKGDIDRVRELLRSSLAIDKVSLSRLDIVERLEEPIPELSESASPSDVAMALSGSADSRLFEGIADAKMYKRYRTWALKIGAEEVKQSGNAWVSFAVDSEALLEKSPVDEDLAIEEFRPTAEAGRFDFTVCVKDVEIGSEALAENLKKVFGLAGATTLDAGAFMPENVEVEFDAPKDGKLKFTAKPAKKSDRFFMRVKVK